MITEKEFLKITSKILKINKIELSLRTTISNIKEWDSLTSIKIFVQLQKKTKKKLNISEFSNFNSLEDLFKRING